MAGIVLEALAARWQPRMGSEEGQRMAELQWASLRPSTRLLYSRAVLLWAKFCAKNGVAMGDASTADVAGFVQGLAGTHKAQSIKGILSGIKTVWAMFDEVYPAGRVHYILLKGLERSQPEKQDRGALCPHDWVPKGLTD